MSISANDLLTELILGGRVIKKYAPYNGWTNPKKRIYLIRHNGERRVIQYSPIGALVRRNLVWDRTISGVTEWYLRIPEPA